MAVRVAAGRILAERFRAGETVAALGSSRTKSRMVAVMPAYGVHRAVADMRGDLANLAQGRRRGLGGRAGAIGHDASSTFTALLSSAVG